jgi:hypothetical protein
MVGNGLQKIKDMLKLIHVRFNKKKHSWKNNKCVRCGLVREYIFSGKWARYIYYFKDSNNFTLTPDCSFDNPNQLNINFTKN